MILRFELTMPNNNSWNGVDAGNKGGYYIFRNVDKATTDRLDGTNHYYNFGDGWGANVSVKKERKTKSNGFRGYDWMVDEILEFGEIKKVDERRYSNKLESAFKDFIKEFIKENGAIKTDSTFQFQKLHTVFNHEMYCKLNNI
jgi:hypothetical protein